VPLSSGVFELKMLQKRSVVKLKLKLIASIIRYKYPDGDVVCPDFNICNNSDICLWFLIKKNGPWRYNHLNGSDKLSLPGFVAPGFFCQQ
jgi:hypothetical protein